MNSSIGEEHSTIVIIFPPKIENTYSPFLLKEELIQLATNFAGISVVRREERTGIVMESILCSRCGC